MSYQLPQARSVQDSRRVRQSPVGDPWAQALPSSSHATVSRSFERCLQHGVEAHRRRIAGTWFHLSISYAEHMAPFHVHDDIVNFAQLVLARVYCSQWRSVLHRGLLGVAISRSVHAWPSESHSTNSSSALSSEVAGVSCCFKPPQSP